MSHPLFLWRMLRNHGWFYFASGLIAVVGFVWIVILPGYLLRAVFDTIAGPEPAPVWWLIALLIGVHAGYAIIWLADFVADRLAVFGTATLLSRNLLSIILQRPGARSLNGSPGDTIPRFRDDVGGLSELFALEGLGYAIIEPALCLVVVGLMIQIDALLTVIGLAPLLVMVFATQLASRRLQRYRTAILSANSRIGAAIAELFGAVQAIQVAGAERYTAAYLARLADSRRGALVRASVAQMALHAVHQNSVQIATGLILLAGAQSIRAGSFTVGDFALFAYFLDLISNTFLLFGGGLALISKTTVSIDRLNRFLDTSRLADLVEPGPTYLRGALPEFPPMARPAERFERLEVTGLSFRYPNSGRGIEDISFTLERGQFLVITGSIGSGKTTLLRVLLGLLPADSGELRWNGTVVPNPAEFLVPPRVAYTAQVPRLFSETIADNVLLGLSADEVNLPAAIRLAVLDPDLAEMPDGIQTLVGPKGVRLSGGQVQRTAAARMLVRDPEIFVADDLSSALDVATESALWAGIRSRAGRTGIVVSHRPATIQMADRVLELRDGRLANDR